MISVSSLQRRALILLPGPGCSTGAVIQSSRVGAVLGVPGAEIDRVLADAEDAVFMEGQESGGGPVVDGWRRVR